jgi:hypothetical protein
MMRVALVVLFVASVLSQLIQDVVTPQPPMVFPIFTSTRDGLGSFRNNVIYDQEFSPINNQILVYIGDQAQGPTLGAFPFLESPRTELGWFNVSRVSPNANTNVKPGDRVFIRPDLVPGGVLVPACPPNQIVLLNARLIQPEIFDADPTNRVNPPATGLDAPILGTNRAWNQFNQNWGSILRTQVFCVWDANTVLAKISPSTFLDQLTHPRQVTPGQNSLNPGW